MLSDHDNLTAAAAAPAPQSDSSANPDETPTTVEPGRIETHVHVSEATPEATPAPTAHTDSSPQESHGKASAEATSSDEPTTSDEEAGSEEMSKLMEQYDEQHEAA